MAGRYRLVQPFLRYFTARCDDVAAISSYTARNLAEMTGREPRIIPYGIAVPEPPRAASDHQLAKALEELDARAASANGK